MPIQIIFQFLLSFIDIAHSLSVCTLACRIVSKAFLHLVFLLLYLHLSLRSLFCSFLYAHFLNFMT